MTTIHRFETIPHQVDLCVVGGGMAGLIAAMSAARHGAKVLLMQDRPVLGGNASSEIRMWICGARGADAKETGLLEEIMLSNYYRNRSMKYALWDTVLYEKARYTPGITLLLNTACHEVTTDGNHIVSVKGYQSTTQSFHEVQAKYFADCSGDSVLRICGAEQRWGRESRYEFNESHAPEVADPRTMGNTILLQSREVGGEPLPFIPPTWALKFTEADLPNRYLTPTGENFWWLELGGMQNTIADAETLRDELLKTGLGVWDLIKNHPDGRAKDWELEWIGALPGKRENVRYVGDHILNQNEVLDGGRFADTVAYGGWPMDDHNPGGLYYRGAPTIFHNTPSPFGIPYRSLYSKNIDNLFFAGRNISASHMAMSATRVMATCSLCGQAAGTAAALAVKYACSPRAVGEHHLYELQGNLMDDDCFLPGFTRPIPEIALQAELSAANGDAGAVRSGIDRVYAGSDNGWWGQPGEALTYTFDSPRQLSRARLVFDSNQSDTKRMPCWYPKGGNVVQMPPMLARDFALEALDGAGHWQRIHLATDNHQRLVKIPLALASQAIRLVPLASWGGGPAHVMAFEVS
jgi:hypothetical protein